MPRPAGRRKCLRLEVKLATPLLVTSSSPANGDGFGALLAFESDGRLRGTFIDDQRIGDPRGPAVDPKEKLLFLDSDVDRILAISPQGRIIRDTERIGGLNPGGGTFGRDGRYYVGLRTAHTIIALSTSLDANAQQVFSPQDRTVSPRIRIRLGDHKLNSHVVTLGHVEDQFPRISR